MAGLDPVTTDGLVKVLHETSCPYGGPLNCGVVAAELSLHQNAAFDTCENQKITVVQMLFNL